jgi:teichuronic acid exporter
LYPLHVINLNVLIAQGRSDLFFRLEIIKKIVGIILITFTVHWGISIMIVGQIVCSLISYFLNSYYTEKFLNYSFIEQFYDIFHSLFLAMLMGVGIYMIKFLSISQLSLLLTAQIVTGIVSYVVLCRLTKLPLFMEVWQIIKSKLFQLCRIQH